MANIVENSLFDKRYLLNSCVGTGSFSEVWKARDQKTDTTVALKIFAPDKGIDQDGIEVFREEYRNTDELMHPHILQAKYFDICDNSPYLVLPYCKGRSLSAWLARKHPFGEREVVEVMAQIGSALAYIHERKDEDRHIMVHKDVKPANILVKDERLGTYLLADFGISNRMKQTVARSIVANAIDINSHNSFTPAYAPPEVHRTLPAPAGDIFSFGMTLLELIYGKALPYAQPLGQILDQTKELPELPNISDRFSDDLCALVLACLEYDKKKRPTANELAEKAHYYLKNGTWQPLYLPTQSINRESIEHAFKGLNTPNEEDTIPVSKSMVENIADEEDTIATPKINPNDRDIENSLPISAINIAENIPNADVEKAIPPPPPRKETRPIIEEPIIDKNEIKDHDITPHYETSPKPKQSNNTYNETATDKANIPSKGVPKALIAAFIGLLGAAGAWFGGLIPGTKTNTPTVVNTIWENDEIVKDLSDTYRRQLNQFYTQLDAGSKMYRLLSADDWTLVDFKMENSNQKSLACIVRNNATQPPVAKLLIWHPNQQDSLVIDNKMSNIPCNECKGIVAMESTVPTVCAASIETAKDARPVTMPYGYLKTDEANPQIFYHTKSHVLGRCYGKQ
jgi:serine/threonine protein kinase